MTNSNSSKKSDDLENYDEIEDEIEDEISEEDEAFDNYFELDQFIENISYSTEIEKIKELDYSGRLLLDIPPNLGKLIYLEKLDLSFTGILSLPSEIGNLTKLKSLILDGNSLCYLPETLNELKQLKFLSVSGNSIGEFPDEIVSLKQLEELNLSNNKIKSLPDQIKKLTKLKRLFLSKNSITQLPSSIGELRNLELLAININHLTKLPPEIGRLKKLTFLLVGNAERIGEYVQLSIPGLGFGNEISELPEEIKKLIGLKYLDLLGNPLAVPPEILEKSNNPEAIINFYFTRHGKRTKALNEAKILVVGESTVGKTSLVKRMLYNSYNSNEGKTEGISISRWVASNSRNENVNLNIWDFGGQEILHATHQFFMTHRALYLLVVDSRNSEEQNKVEYWLKIINSFGGNSPIIIVGNKMDQHPLDIDQSGLKKKYPNIIDILEVSAATNKGIETLKSTINKRVNKLQHIRDLLPETWFTVKTKLEELGRESNFITHDKYLELCAENEVSDETSQRTLIGFLHDLGVVLHFQDDPRLEALGILNPQWVTNGVYKILNSHTLFQNKGVLTVAMLDEILNLPEYPRGKRLFIVDMMKKFELCYDIPYGYDVEPDKTFLVPDLLPKDEPAELKFNGVPAFEYAYPVLPSSVITRFIVRMNQKIDGGFVWRTGVVLKIGENKALVKADIEDRKIAIAIDGVEHTRRDALSAIRYQLDEIHASIKGLDAQKRVPIPEAPESEPLDYDYLLQLERDGFEEHPVKNGNRLVKVNVRKLLSGVVSEAERRQSAVNTTNIYNIHGDVKDSTIISGDENEVKR